MANSGTSAGAGASNMTSLEAVLPLNRLVIYAGDVEETAAFYETHFGFKRMRLPGDRIVELVAQDGGAAANPSSSWSSMSRTSNPSAPNAPETA